MWIPKWLGEIYSRLFVHFELELFTFNQAKSILSMSEGKLSVAFSKLHSRRLMTIFERSVPRVYRLMDPEFLAFTASEILKNVQMIPQERYLRLIFLCFREILRARDIELTSFAIYGSVARGTAKKNSDIDVLLVSESFQGSLGSRLEWLCELEESLQDEINWLSEQGIHTHLSYYPLRKEEAELIPLLFLDMTEEAIILYDKGRFLESLLLELKSKLIKRGVRRIFIDDEHWYWDLKPDYKFGELIEVT